MPEIQRPSLRFAAGLVAMIVGWSALMLAQLVAPFVALALLVIGYLATVLTEHRTGRRLRRRLRVPPRYVCTR